MKTRRTIGFLVLESILLDVDGVRFSLHFHEVRSAVHTGTDTIGDQGPYDWRDLGTGQWQEWMWRNNFRGGVKL